jgi:hypothetical protein
VRRCKLALWWRGVAMPLPHASNLRGRDHDSIAGDSGFAGMTPL